MNERGPGENWKEGEAAIRAKDAREREADTAAGLELQKQDREDPVHGPVVQLTDDVYREANVALKSGGPLWGELNEFANSFEDNVPNARRYRLFHVLTRSTPGGSDNLFDVDPEGEWSEWSIEAKMKHFIRRYKIRALAEKYDIDLEAE